MFSLKPKPNPDGTPAAKVLPFRQRKSIVALDVDAGVLRVVHASGQGTSARVTRISAAKLDLPQAQRENPETFGAAIKAALESIKLNPREAALALPRGQVVLRPLQVPMASDLRELASIINFQIARDLPFRLEDAAIDFKVLRVVEVAPPARPDESAEGEPKAQDAVEKRLEVLVGAVRADLVEFHRRMAKAAGFKLVSLGLRSVAAAQCASRCDPGNGTAVLLLICVRRDEITIEVVSDGKLVFSRAAALAVPQADEIPPAERSAFLQTLGIEVVRSIHGYEGTPGHRPVQKILVAGGTGLETEIRALLSNRLNLPGEILNPAAAFQLRSEDSAEATGAIAPIGLALSALEPGGLPIDFANPKKPPVQRNTKRTQVLLAAVATMALLVTLFGIRFNLVKKRLKIKQEVQAQLTDAEKKLPIYRRLKAQGKVVAGWMAEDQNWLDHIAYLTAILPGAEELYVSAFTTTAQHVLRFSVQARTGELLAELDKKLRAAGYEVKPLSITPANDKHGYNFRTTVELSIPKKMKPDIAKAKPPPRPADDVSLKPARRS